MAHIRFALIIMAAALAAYAVYEFRLWSKPASELELSTKQRRIRVIGLVLLLTSIGLWYHGTYLPIPHKPAFPTPAAERLVKRQAADYLAYWMFTFVVLVTLVPLALLDARENVLNALAERRNLREETVGATSSIGRSSDSEAP